LSDIAQRENIQQRCQQVLTVNAEDDFSFCCVDVVRSTVFVVLVFELFVSFVDGFDGFDGFDAFDGFDGFGDADVDVFASFDGLDRFGDFDGLDLFEAFVLDELFNGYFRFVDFRVDGKFDDSFDEFGDVFEAIEV
jgi:hypothetical protein